MITWVRWLIIVRFSRLFHYTIFLGILRSNRPGTCKSETTPFADDHGTTALVSVGIPSEEVSEGLIFSKLMFQFYFQERRCYVCAVIKITIRTMAIRKKRSSKMTAMAVLQWFTSTFLLNDAVAYSIIKSALKTSWHLAMTEMVSSLKTTAAREWGGRVSFSLGKKHKDVWYFVPQRIK